jgi:hypothetical protein
MHIIPVLKKTTANTDNNVNAFRSHTCFRSYTRSEMKWKVLWIEPGSKKNPKANQIFKVYYVMEMSMTWCAEFIVYNVTTVRRRNRLKTECTSTKVFKIHTIHNWFLRKHLFKYNFSNYYSLIKWSFLYSLSSIKFVVSLKKLFIHFPIRSYMYVKLFPMVAAILELWLSQKSYTMLKKKHSQIITPH